jgi:hypothetical protein
MEQSLSLVPIGCLLCQEIYILLNPNAHLCVHNNFPLTSVLNQMSPVHTIPPSKQDALSYDPCVPSLQIYTLSSSVRSIESSFQEI